MTTINERLLDRVRMDLGDMPMPFDFSFSGDGVRDHFNIEHRPFDPDSIVLLEDGSTVTDPAGAGITFDAFSGMVVFDAPPAAGVLYEMSGRKWRYFSDDDLQVFINTAITQHLHSRADVSGGQFNANDLEPVEEYPVALLSTIQALWALATDAAFDIDIMAPDGVNIPRSERYRQLLDMIGARQTQYDEISSALNIGLKRMDTFTVRRTAKNTNRLVPVYLPKEYDDHTMPKRVLFPPMLQGTPPVKTSVGNYDINITSGDPYSEIFDFEFDLTGCVIKNAIRKGPLTGYMSTVGPAIHEFTQEVMDGPTGLLKLSLTGAETRRIPYNSYWEIQIQKPYEDEPYTYIRGLVRATNNEVVR